MAKDLGKGIEGISVQRIAEPSLKEQAGWNPKWTIEKYDENGVLFEKVDLPGNMLLNAGITRMWNLITGTATNPYNNANARIGVGDSTAAEAPTQTELQGTNKLFKGMDSGFPQVSDQTAVFKSTFGGAEANFAWNEFAVDNGAGAAELMNRKVSNQGTKTAGQTWVVTLEITLS